MSSWGSVSLSHSFDCVFVGSDVHYWNSRDFSNPSLEILITSGHNVAAVLFNPLDYAVVGIGSFMVALEPFKPRVFGDPEGDSVPNSELFELSNYAVSDIGDALAEEAIHAGFENI